MTMLSLYKTLASEEFWVCWSCLWSVVAKLWCLTCSWCRTVQQFWCWARGWHCPCAALRPCLALAVSPAPSSCSQYRLPYSCLMNLEIPHEERTEKYRTTACPTPSLPAAGNWSQVHLTLTEVMCCGKETLPPSSNSTANTPWGNSFLSQ